MRSKFFQLLDRDFVIAAFLVAAVVAVLCTTREDSSRLELRGHARIQQPAKPLRPPTCDQSPTTIATVVEWSPELECELWELVSRAVEAQQVPAQVVEVSPTPVVPTDEVDRLERGMRNIWSKVKAIEQQTRSTWHASYVAAYESSRITQRPVVVVITEAGCDACDRLVARLKAKTSLPYEFCAINRAEESAGGQTIGELFECDKDTTYPLIVGVWGDFQVPITEEFLR